MSSSFVAENWASMTTDGHYEIPPLMESNILMSLLEEPQFEDSDHDDHERLSSVIQSLEAEIEPIVMDDDHVLLEEDSQSSDGQTDGEDCSRAHDDGHLDFSWVDMEMMASSSPSDEMTNWYTEYYSCGDEMDCVVGIGGVRDYFDDHHQDHEVVYDGYSNSLWQETYESVNMYA